jgi:hypothetical protein
MRYLFGFLCVCALGAMPVVGCSETGGTGGTGGSGGIGAACDGNVCICNEAGIRAAIEAGGDHPYTFACDGPTTVASRFQIDNDVILDGEDQLVTDGFGVLAGVKAELHGFSVTNQDLVADVSGIVNSGTLLISNTGVWRFEGPGISNQGTLTLVNSTVSDNYYRGISNGGTLVIINSTVSGNLTGGVGIAAAGIYNWGTLTVTNSTVSNNREPLTPGGVDIHNAGTATLTNTLIEGDCGGSVAVISGNYNIESPEDTCGLTGDSDQVNINAEQLNLGPLADNGGPTMTHKPGDGGFGDGSVAIDVIPEADCGVTTDQRGELRPETGGTMCDVGAFEVQP